MLAPSSYRPGQEVRLSNGVTGVLYARTRRLAWPPRDEAPTWYFLPDHAAAVGLAVMSQPREVSEVDIVAAGVCRPGAWPSAEHCLERPFLQRVYAAHMQRMPLPLPGPGD